MAGGGAMSCPNCSGMMAEVMALRRQLAIDLDRGKAEILGAALQLTPQQSVIVAILHDAKGRPIQRGLLLDLLPVVWGEREDTKIIDVQIHRIRKALGAGFIDTFRASGYQLSADGRALCDEALAPKVAA